ncbi:MAG TPA: pyridoxal-phosphate dependent enzyme, partial [Edaphobacter sp.]|nr:pyridoxal-phosphate dependent enzyme [Edaphobacter sp.]
IVALEPAESPFLSTGQGGAHRVEGIGTGFWPPHLKPDDYDETRTISEVDARHMARRLASEEGILAGTSSGLNVVAAIRLAVELGPKASVVTLFCDSGFKYLSGDLFA